MLMLKKNWMEELSKIIKKKKNKFFGDEVTDFTIKKFQRWTIIKLV